ncbi:TetR/AcrR family transcriptional regulator [Methylobacterium aerolatum]|uniref:AcrR family transcriptional regulator n=1 Tax=Methylobacterium aerolatum TaxID=418708 RepID=A0ABU0HUF2_9HYPH|nr:TetR/AcrR family transcriptional regulator [Methylobacterium aerolatum]MDQ0445950.1 AcrR family transcriptional regulator [Methylobacterium aerolatum]GJD35790.1 HTH-type transcriptional regulator BetI [Methylobacterium aerolatum]
MKRRLADRAETILDAAHTVLRERGAGGLTMDAVAAAAGLSKGGVLHHYASKDALVAALVARKFASLRAGIAQSEAAEAEGPQRLARAMVDHFCETCRDEDEFSRALITASIENPAALADYRSFVVERLTRLSEAEAGTGSGSVVFFAILGLALGRALGFYDMPQDEIETWRKALTAVADTSQK